MKSPMSLITRSLQIFASHALVLLLLSSPVVNAATRIATMGELRVSVVEERTRMVFELDGEIRHSVFTLNNPDRVVIDLDAVILNKSFPEIVMGAPIVRSIRSAVRNDRVNPVGLRIVLDVNQHVRPQSFLLKPESGQGYRLVLDLFTTPALPALASASVTSSVLASTPIQPATAVIPALPVPSPTASTTTAAVKNLFDEKGLRDVVIAIDAGHGGKDPGASGRYGTREKDVVLQIARVLADSIEREKGMKAVLIRDGDYYLPLRDRINKARAHKADLFVSVHADAINHPNATGASVYALSLKGATSEAAKWLADRENASDLIGGVSLGDKDKMVASVLLDLSQTATIQSSLDVGGEILSELKRFAQLHRKTVQQAGFVVLKSPDIPSILIETAFISNPKEEKRLGDKAYQQKMATGIVGGLKRYFARKAPPGTWLAYQYRGIKEVPQSVHTVAQN